MPKYQVNKFQIIADISPAKITCRLMADVSTVLAIVSTICSSKTKNAIKLKKAAQTTACKGVRTFVETTVAIEFAAS
jgi:pyruvate formate-lyase activating enzyme-like uncharacterized protein